MSTSNIQQQQIITSRQCKAARMLLGWKQIDLAKKSEVGSATIGNFENEVRIPQTRTLKNIKSTFEQAGIEFDDNDKFCLIKLNK